MSIQSDLFLSADQLHCAHLFCQAASRQHHGVWEREFFFDHSEGRFELCEDEATLENGVLTMVLKRLGLLSLSVMADQRCLLSALKL